MLFSCTALHVSIVVCSLSHGSVPIIAILLLHLQDQTGDVGASAGPEAQGEAQRNPIGGEREGIV